MKPLVEEYGEMWARNDENIQAIPGSRAGGLGVYVLYDGSMPVYIGKGNLRQRIRNARSSNRRGEFWDHFSWYVIPDSDLRHDVEVLFLRGLPSYLRSLTRQRGKLRGGNKRKPPNKGPVDSIRRKKGRR